MRTAEPISRGGLSSGPSALTVRGSLDRGPGCLRACGWAMWGGEGPVRLASTPAGTRGRDSEVQQLRARVSGAGQAGQI